MQNMQGKTALGLDANVGALLCYLGNLVCALGLIYSIIVVVTDKTNKLTRFHAFQSILLTVAAGVILPIIYTILLVIAMVLDAVLIQVVGIPLISILLIPIIGIIGLVIFILLIMAAIKAFQGQIYKIPIIGNFADKFSN